MRLRIVLQSVFGGLLAVALPWAAQAAPVNTAETCPVVIDDHTEDWANVPVFYHDDTQDFGGTQYYWTGTEWTTTEPESYDFTANVDAMADFQNLKLCNDAVSMYMYIDTFEPLFAVHDLVNDEYMEPRFFERTGAPTNLPQTFDSWFVLSIQEAFSDQMYFYVAHVVEAEDELVTADRSPELLGLYKDEDGNKRFDPNADTLLAEFSDEGPELDKRNHCLVDNVWVCGDHFDVDGGMEVKLELLNKFGLGLFTQTNIEYGDTVTIQASIIPGGTFLSASRQGVQRSPKFTYTIAKAGVQEVEVPSNKLTNTAMNVRWDKLGLAKYTVQLMDAKGKVLSTQYGIDKPRTRFTKLSADTLYKVRVQAKVAGIVTPWSRVLTVRTAE